MELHKHAINVKVGNPKLTGFQITKNSHLKLPNHLLYF
ncbi:MAG: hypothetical protein ACI85I_000089 [Arenicella sp.]|jgi:hypothetical protein